MTDPKPHGGARKGIGRPSISATGVVLATAKMSPAQRDKLIALGGSAWLRAMIDQAPAVARPQRT